MFRKLIVTIAAVAAIGFAAIPTDAHARWHGGGWHGHGGWHGGWRGPRFGFYGYGPAYAYGVGYPGCYRTVRVATPYGWRWRRVWVCG